MDAIARRPTRLYVPTAYIIKIVIKRSIGRRSDETRAITSNKHYARPCGQAESIFNIPIYV